MPFLNSLWTSLIFLAMISFAVERSAYLPVSLLLAYRTDVPFLFSQITLPVLENTFSQRINAIIQKVREMRRGVYYPHLYVVKEDGEPPLRLWALSALIQDRADVLPSYQQFISSLKEKVNTT